MHTTIFIGLLILLVANCISISADEEELYPCKNFQKWAQNYKAMWKSIMDPNHGAFPKRYGIGVPIKAGLADVLLGYVTAFLLSVFTNRAFLIQKVDRLEFECDTRMIEYAFVPRHINWTVPWHLERSRYQCVLPKRGSGYGGVVPCDDREPFTLPGGLGPIKSRGQLTMDGSTKSGFCQAPGKNCRNMSSSGAEEMVFYMGNRGSSYNIFSNPYHSQTVRDMGLTPETCLSCIFHFLFKRKPETCEGACLQTEKKLQLLRADPNAVSIGIQVRNPGHFEEHFFCMESLNAYYKAQGKTVTILLVVGDPNLQKSMKAKYGDQLLLPVGGPSQPITVHDRQDVGNCTLQAEKDKTAMLESVRDMHLLSLADIQVVSRDSGFGLFGALMRARSNPRIYRMPLGPTPTWRNCSADLGGDPLEVFANAWSGL